MLVALQRKSKLGGSGKNGIPAYPLRDRLPRRAGQHIWSISGWIEARGVYDDICYLRQAHLFDRFGLCGIDTNITFDDDYLKNKLKEIDFPEWNDVKRTPCHTWISGADKYVLQYPPGPASFYRCFPPDSGLSRSTY